MVQVRMIAIEYDGAGEASAAAVLVKGARVRGRMAMRA
jgi:hypothetical protein